MGTNHYYETAAFEARWDDPYWEADINKVVRFTSNWKLLTCERETDLEANKMHEDVVTELTNRLLYADPYMIPTNAK